MPCAKDVKMIFLALTRLKGKLIFTGRIVVAGCALYSLQQKLIRTASGQTPPKSTKMIEIEPKGKKFLPLVTVIQASIEASTSFELNVKAATN